MAFFNWSEDLSVGVMVIDEQHKMLIDMVNRLYDAMRAGKAKEIIKPLLGELADYTRYHFTEEEKLMKRIGYPELAEHAKAHQEFVAEVRKQLDLVAQGRLASSVELANFLKNWLTQHIGEVDQAYGPSMMAAKVR